MEQIRAALAQLGFKLKTSEPFIVSCTILDTRALYPQETALGGLCEVRYVSGQPQSPVSHRGYLKTYTNGSKNYLRDVQLCPSLRQLLHTLSLRCKDDRGAIARHRVDRGEQWQIVERD